MSAQGIETGTLPWYFKVPSPTFEEPACQDADPDLFYQPDDKSGRPTNKRVDAARRICAPCPHIVECALHGLKHERYGVWGGLDEQDRAALGGTHASPLYGVSAKTALARLIKRLTKSGISEDHIASIGLLWDVTKAKIGRPGMRAKRFDEVEHGTWQGVEWHRARGEWCDTCKDFRSGERRRQRREKAEREAA